MNVNRRLRGWPRMTPPQVFLSAQSASSAVLPVRDGFVAPMYTSLPGSWGEARLRLSSSPANCPRRLEAASTFTAMVSQGQAPSALTRWYPYVQSRLHCSEVPGSV